MKMITTIMAIVLMSSAAALAQPGPQAGKGMRDEFAKRGPRAERMMDELDLTQEQRDQLMTLRKEARQTMQPLHQSLREARDATRRLIMTDDAPDAEIIAAVEAEGEAYMALSVARVEHQLKVRAIVGAEKAARLVEMRDERREERGGPGGPREE